MVQQAQWAQKFLNSASGTTMATALKSWGSHNYSIVYQKTTSPNMTILFDYNFLSYNSKRRICGLSNHFYFEKFEIQGNLWLLTLIIGNSY